MQGICLFMQLFGMHLCVYSIFLKAGSLYKFAIALAVASIWFTVLAAAPLRRLEHKVKSRYKIPFVKYPVADLFLLFTLIIWGILTVRYLGHIKADMTTLTDAVAHRQRQYNYSVSGAFQPYADRYHGAVGTWIVLDLELLAGLFMSRVYAHRHGMFWGTLPAALLVACGLLWGKAPTIPAMILLIAGILGTQMCYDEFHVGGSRHFRQISVSIVRHRLFYPIMLVCILVLFGAGARLSVATKDQALQGEEKLLKTQHTMEKQIVNFGVRTVQKIQALLGIEQPGVLTNTSPKFTGETVLTLTVDKKPTEDIYLRGFIGTRYENGRWSNSKKKKISGLFGTETCYQLLTQDYNVYQARKLASDNRSVSYQEYLADPDSMGQKNAMHMKIKYEKGNPTTFAYFPYFSKLDESSMGTLMLDYDKGFRRSDDVSEYEVLTQKTRMGLRFQASSAGLLQKECVPYYAGERLGNQESVTIYETDDDNFGSNKQQITDGEDMPSLEDGKYYVAVSDPNLGRYFQYVLSEDLWLPGGLTQTKQLAKDLLVNYVPITKTTGSGRTIFVSPDQTIKSLRIYLNENTKYSQTLKAKEVGTDYVENFLFVQKLGYCEHYATAGAVLFRAMGIPSRYVSGYRVPASDFVDNGDGTYTAKVLDQEAHAWTEVYSLSSGWTVADMTPSAQDATGQINNNGSGFTQTAPTEEPDYGDDTFLENDPQSSEKAAQDPSETEEPEITEEPAATEHADGQNGGSSDQMDASSDGSSSGTSAGSDAGKSALSPKQKKILLAVTGTVAVLLLLWLIWYSQRLRRRYRLRKCHGGGAYLLELNHQLEQVLRCCGFGKPEHMTDQEYLTLLSGLDPKGVESGMTGRYFRQLERARFDRECGSKEEIRDCVRFVRGVKRAALASAGTGRKFYAGLRAWK